MTTFVLDFRRDNVDGPVLPGKITSATSLIELQGMTDIVFLVHGFNVSRPAGSIELQTFATLLPSIQQGAAVAVLWPGDASVGAVSYPFETNNADDTGVALAQFISDNLTLRPRLSFVAHSLGCRVVMTAIRQLWIDNVPVSQVCLMAGAIDNDSLADTAWYRSATQYAARVAVLHSPSDHVLRSAYPPGALVGAFLHWTATSAAALGYTGPRAAAGTNGAIPGTVQACGIPAAAAVDHGDYLPSQNGTVNAKQQAAANYANATLVGMVPLTY